MPTLEWFSYFRHTYYKIHQPDNHLSFSPVMKWPLSRQNYTHNQERSEFMNKALAHLHTINKHKLKVTWLCFRCHLYKQGLLHDLSKYSYIELKTGFHYYQGFRSPIDAERSHRSIYFLAASQRKKQTSLGILAWFWSRWHLCM